MRSLIVSPSLKRRASPGTFVSVMLANKPI